jgi:peptide/nickel transport system substrate-binding protein
MIQSRTLFSDAGKECGRSHGWSVDGARRATGRRNGMRRLLVVLAVVLAGMSVLGYSAEPQYGGTLVVASMDIKNINNLWFYDVAAYYLCEQVYSTLVIMDYGVTVGKDVYGDLAKSWEVSEDGLTYTFHLHDNVYWHDGVKLTAADVEFSYNTAIAKKYPIAKYLDGVESITTPDEYTVVMKRSTVNAAFLPMLGQASNWFGQIIPKHLYEGTDISTNPYNKNPVGSGPFKFVEWQPGSYVRLAANENYFRGRPYLDGPIFRIYSSVEVAQADFKAGGVDYLGWTFTPPYNQLETYTSLPNRRAWPQVSIYTHGILFNQTRAPFNNVLVREAISLAVDREEICEIAYSGLVEPWDSTGAAGTPLYNNTSVHWPSRNVERAKALLDQAGYPEIAGGTRMEIGILCTVAQFYKELSEVVVEQLKDVGIRAKVELVDNAAWFSRMGKQDFDLAAYYPRTGPDPDAYREHFGTDAARNYGKYSDPRVDELLTQGIGVIDVAARTVFYNEVQELLRQDYAYLPLAVLKYFELSPANLHGTPMGDADAYGKSFGWASYYVTWLEQ